MAAGVGDEDEGIRPHRVQIVPVGVAPVREFVLVVAAPTHPLANKRNIRFSQLANEAFIVRERGSDTWNSMEEGFAGRLSNLKIAMEIKSTETIKQAVIAGMGIAFLSAHTISLELQLGHLVVLDVESFPVMLNWYVVHRKNKRLPPVAQAFKDFLLSDAASLMARIVPSADAAHRGDGL